MSGPAPAAAPVADRAVAFAASEAARQATGGATVETGAREVLRLASRRRTVIETALDHLREDSALDEATRAQARAILERVLTVGLLF